MLRIFSLVVLAAMLVGCAKKGPTELTLEQVPEALRKAFASANNLLKTSADSVAKLVTEKQYAAASLQLQALAGNTDLTDEQRGVVSGATVAVNTALQEMAAAVQVEAATSAPGSPAPPQAAKEDAAAAAAVLEHYKRTK
ncbi:MAG TPA: hypothetical protein VF773_00935 [Verrucomicrobiae bacterium]